MDNLAFQNKKLARMAFSPATATRMLRVILDSLLLVHSTDKQFRREAPSSHIKIQASMRAAHARMKLAHAQTEFFLAVTPILRAQSRSAIRSQIQDQIVLRAALA